MEENENLVEDNNSNKLASTNGLAIAGFVVSMCSLFINFGGIVGLIGTILSAFGLSKVKVKGTGKGLSIAGLVIGTINVVYGIWSIVNLATTLNNLNLL